MSGISISVDIAGKSFPLTVKQEEEPVVRAAAENISRTFEKYRKRFPTIDKSDILSMVLLELETTRQRTVEKKEDAGLIAELSDINAVLGSYLDQQ